MTASVLKQDPTLSKRQKLNQNKISFSLSFFIVINRLYVVQVSFCGLTKGISPKICVLCARVKTSKRSFEPFCVWILKFHNANNNKKKTKKKLRSLYMQATLVSKTPKPHRALDFHSLESEKAASLMRENKIYQSCQT